MGDPVLPPKDFTPVCTTELGYMAKIEPEFIKRNVKLIGLSVDPSEAHARWLNDIEETQGAKVNYPIIADHDLKISKLYNMLPAEEPGTSEGRTAATNQTVRTVYVIGPDKKIKLLLAYPMTHGPQLRRDPARGRLACSSPPSTGRRQQLEARRRRHHRRLGERRRRQEAFPRRLAVAEALYPHRQAAGLSGLAVLVAHQRNSVTSAGRIRKHRNSRRHPRAVRSPPPFRSANTLC